MEEKTILTIDDLKNNNKYKKKSIYNGFLNAIIYLIIITFLFYNLIKNKGDDNEVIFVITAFVLFFSFSLFLKYLFSIKSIKKEDKDNLLIEDNNFKIVEDKIYDRFQYLSTDARENKKLLSYIVTKIYGNIPVSVSFFERVKKDDSIYLLFYEGSEENKKSKYIDQCFLASEYELSKELYSYFIPYNVSLGESKYNDRINSKIRKLKERGIVYCKNCDTKIKLKKSEFCPKCNEKYKINVNDVICERKWYIKE